MMVLGIPPYRLRRDLLDAEIRAILDMGVELRTGVRLGEDFSLASLKQEGFGSVFLGIGAMRSRDLQIPGVDLDGPRRGVCRRSEGRVLGDAVPRSPRATAGREEE